MLLTTAAAPTVRRMRERVGPHVGELFTPRHYHRPTDIPWACDNDGFQGFRPAPFLRMLAAVAHLPGCKFVACPDVVGDARETLTRFMRWAPIIRELDLPVAYVMQDGLERVGVPWDLTDAVFVGGSTEFKLGDTAIRTCREAKERGKWVHVGRVNSVRRIRYAQSIGADSVDGTQWARWRDRYLDTLRVLPYEQQGLR